MTTDDCPVESGTGMGFFERYLTVWVGLCIAGGVILGKLAPNLATRLDGMAIHVDEAPVISIPIALCLFFMMYPIMVKIDFAEVLKAGRTLKPVGLTLFLNWVINPRFPTRLGERPRNGLNAERLFDHVSLIKIDTRGSVE